MSSKFSNSTIRHLIIKCLYNLTSHHGLYLDRELSSDHFEEISQDCFEEVTPSFEEEDDDELKQLVHSQVPNKAREYLKEILIHWNDIFVKIQSKLQTRSIESIGKIEFSILMLATFEISYRKDVPPKVALKEALLLATKYADTQSSAFVNGILDTMIREI